MSGKNNIFLNHTLNEYNAKYRNRRYKLLTYTEQEIEGYDKEHGFLKDDVTGETYKVDVLKHRKWWKIGNKYYEIPKFPRWTWFRNLRTGAQVATWTILAVGLAIGTCATGVVHYIRFGNYRIVEINSDYSDVVKCTYREISGGIAVTLTPKNESIYIEDVKRVTLGENELLQDCFYTYEIDNNKLFIDEMGLRSPNAKHIIITPTIAENR